MVRGMSTSDSRLTTFLVFMFIVCIFVACVMTVRGKRIRGEASSSPVAVEQGLAP